MPSCRSVFRSRWFAVVVAALALPSLAFAGKHPVPLEAKADGTTCIACHEDKTKGAHVHSAIATGCTTCHQVRVNKDVTRVKLTTTTPVKLCLTCHADKNAAEAKGKVHSPAVRDCIKCHDPHESANDKQLLKPISGGKDGNLCLGCHTTGLNVPDKGSRHAALDMGCGTCHVTHKTGASADREFRFHLTKPSPALCIDCHDPADAAIAKAHQNQPIAKSDCLTCHDPHQSKSPKLLQAFLHSPFESKACDSCHQPAKDGNIVLTRAGGKELCLICHAEKAEQIEKAKFPHAGAAGDCTDCHSPHAGKSPGFPKPDAVKVCLGCHNDQAEQQKKKDLHQPAFEQGCFTCHEPHGGDNPKLLRAKTPNALCLECHGPDRSPAKVEGGQLVTIFGGKVKLPVDYFGRITALPVKYGLGHPVDRHPVSDSRDPLDSTKAMKMNCLTCHQPHSSAQPNLLVKDQANNMAFCNGCHQQKVPQGEPKPAQKVNAAGTSPSSTSGGQAK